MFHNSKIKEGLIVVFILGLIVAGGVGVALMIRQNNLATSDTSASAIPISYPLVSYAGCIPRPACLDRNPPCELAAANYCPPDKNPLGQICDPKNQDACPTGSICKAITPECPNPGNGEKFACALTIQYRCQKLICPEIPAIRCLPGTHPATGPNGCPSSTCVSDSSSSSSVTGQACLPLDANNDGIIDFKDLGSFAKNYGKHCINQSGSTTSSIKTVDIVANNVGDNDNAAKLRLEAQGVEIIDFKPSSGFPIALPECDNGKMFSSSSVCASLAKSSSIKNGDIIGTVTVKIPSAVGGEVLQISHLSKTNENGYQGNGNTFVVDSGVIATFTPATGKNGYGACGSQDTNDDGIVNFPDLAKFATMYGKKCPMPL